MFFEATPRTLPAKVLSMLMRPILTKSVVRACGQDLDDLKAAVEGGGAGSAAGSAPPARS